ncbi:MAG: hypothetical protein LV480_01070 [Methylacidiphilales bacterium]|nr:hypothetical protein [Candidatus Methylacidiphilales bacterium]
MTAQKVLETVATMPREDWVTIQNGIADMIAAKFSPEEVAEIRSALDEAEAELERGEGFNSEEIRKQLGLR